MFVLHQALVMRFLGRVGSSAVSTTAPTLSDLELLQSPKYLRGMGMLIMTTGYSVLISEHKNLPGFSRTASSSSTGTANSSSANSSGAAGNSSSSRVGSDAAKQGASSSAAAGSG